MMGLTGRMDHKPAELLAVKTTCGSSRALINDPLVVLADEPSGSLDTKTKPNFINCFSSYATNSIKRSLLLLTMNSWHRSPTGQST